MVTQNKPCNVFTCVHIWLQCFIHKAKRCEQNLHINEQIVTQSVSPRGADHALRKAHVLRAINEQAPPMSVMHIITTNRNVLRASSSKEPI